ncbi:Ribosomal RNA large subunit methyltransferase M [Aquicella siphonis]|uniref:Ribosomal RNA large subunit methyltransferase M n=1 Tax=Aquicella siphonis TaxID=254247 RepID=A0A5E4PDC5_9COXI|nr:SAM-dependent methyltransferase [Aquicella siphonis]VVC74919.1 Ribosomal RNA large subunit methyltransferase M [Aquicella siphonis]
MIINKPFSAVYIANPEFINELCQELGSVSAIMDTLVFSAIQKPNVCFARDVWLDPHLVNFHSISDAVKTLRAAGKFWHMHPVTHIRRAHLIQEQLRKLPNLERAFPVENDIPEIGCYSLLDKNTLVYSVKRWKKWPMGHCRFIEDKTHPPNRAYLKLWEALTLLDHYPCPGEIVYDLGASPGGWTYVMQTLGAHVTAIDKAPLNDRIAHLPNVQFVRESAFALDPVKLHKKIDWLLCDIACYPQRLYQLASSWLASGLARQMIFTIKLQGATDLDMIKKFQAIPDSRTLHLFHNKHEATFIHPAPAHLFPRFHVNTLPTRELRQENEDPDQNV